MIILKDGNSEYKVPYFNGREKLALLWGKNRDSIDGEDKIKWKGKKYLLPTPLMEKHEFLYEKYLERASFFNAVGRTAQGMKGLLFRNEPTRVIPAVFDSVLEDFSNKNETVIDFAQRLADEQIKTNLSGILVDFPQSEDMQGLTQAEVEQMNIKPYATLYPAESIIDVRYMTDRSSQKLSMVILYEEEMIDVNEFEKELEKRIRVLDLDESGYRQRVYKAKGGKDNTEKFELSDTVFPLVDGNRLSIIPFIPVTSTGLYFMPQKPILNDLTNLNLSLYRNSADYELALHETCNPTPVFKGITPNPETGEVEPPKLGIFAGIHLNPDGDAFYMQVEGSGISLVKQGMDDKKAEMAVLGARIISPDKKVAETMQSMEINRAGENAVLADLANTLSDAIEETLYLMGLWLGNNTEDISYQINTNYLASMTFEEAVKLATMWQTQAISRKTLFNNLQKGGIISTDITYEEYLEDIENETPLGLGTQDAE